MTFEAVIFDMDGVLLDSEPIHFGALNSVIGEEGFALNEADNEHILGTTLEGTFTYIAGVFSLKHEMSDYYERYDATVMELLSRALDASEGVKDLLESLSAAGVPLAVASSSRRNWVEATLTSLGVRHYFPVVVSGDDVSEGKPDPEIYLRTASQIGIAPDRCIAVEDSPHGILSARRANMFVLAVRTPYTAHLVLEGADQIVDSLAVVRSGALGEWWQNWDRASV